MNHSIDIEALCFEMSTGCFTNSIIMLRQIKDEITEPAYFVHFLHNKSNNKKLNSSDNFIICLQCLYIDLIVEFTIVIKDYR